MKYLIDFKKNLLKNGGINDKIFHQMYHGFHQVYHQMRQVCQVFHQVCHYPHQLYLRTIQS